MLSNIYIFIYMQIYIFIYIGLELGQADRKSRSLIAADLCHGRPTIGLPCCLAWLVLRTKLPENCIDISIFAYSKPQYNAMEIMKIYVFNIL